MELHELIGVFGGLAMLLTIQGFWIGRALSDLRTDVRDLGTEFRSEIGAFRAEVHADMATHTSAIADLRDRVVRLES